MPSVASLLPIAPSNVQWPCRAPCRSGQGVAARPARRQTAQICRVFEENFGVHGLRKVWRQLGREGIKVARCTVACLMRAMALAGIVRERAKRTTFSDQAAPCPLDRVNRDFKAERPNALWADLGQLGLGSTGFQAVSLWASFLVTTRCERRRWGVRAVDRGRVWGRAW
jgi:hypothetical protein